MRWFLFALCFIIQTSLLAQSSFVLKGRVIDKQTGDPLPYASVVYPSKNLGIATDQSGYFQFYLPNAKATESIEISFVGYDKLRILISGFENNKVYALTPSIRKLADVSVLAKPEKFKLKPFMRKVINDFDNSKNSDSHIAYAHYREAALKDGEPIMYIESVGYSIFASNKGWATFANYNFVYEETRAYVDNPDWIEYGSNLAGPSQEGVYSSGRGILRTYRVLEKKGLLSKDNFKKYRFRLDSSYIESNNEFLVVDFKGPFDEGMIHVNSDNYRIQKIEYSSKYIWSAPLFKNIRANIKLDFNYINQVPYLASGSSEYTINGLTHVNQLQVLLQKDATLRLDDETLGIVVGYSSNPIIFYSQDFWDKNPFPFNQGWCSVCPSIDWGNMKVGFQSSANKQLVSRKKQITERQWKDFERIKTLINQFN